MDMERLIEDLKARKKEYLDCYNPEFREGRGLFNQMATEEKIDAKEIALIYRWKLGRMTKANVYAIKVNIGSYLKAIGNARDGEEIKAITILDDIPGCGLAVASTILSIYCPNKFSIIDWRVLEVLGYTSKKAKTDGWKADEYWNEFMQKIKDISISTGTDLRTTDKILWGKSFSDQIDKMLT